VRVAAERRIADLSVQQTVLAWGIMRRTRLQKRVASTADVNATKQRHHNRAERRRDEFPAECLDEI